MDQDFRQPKNKVSLTDIIAHISKSAIANPLLWRRNRDSNPRKLSLQRFSRPPPSTTQPFLHKDVIALYIKKFTYVNYYYLIIYDNFSIIALAAFLPAPIAKITVAAPVTASPPA